MIYPRKSNNLKMETAFTFLKATHHLRNHNGLT